MRHVRPLARSALTALAALAALAAASLPGCGSSPPSRWYTLASTARPDAAAAQSDFCVAVGPVSIPSAVDRPQLVVQAGPNRVTLDEFDRWAAPLADEIARVVATDLSALLGAPRVTTASLASSDPTYQVTIDVQRFDSLPGEAALLEAFWAVRDVARNVTRSGRTVAREALQGDGPEAIAAAHSRALGKLSVDVAAAIRAQATGQR